MSVTLYKDGDCMGISTDAAHEDIFYDQVAVAFSNLIASEAFGHGPTNDWWFQFYNFLPLVTDLANSFESSNEDVRYSGCCDGLVLITTSEL